MRPTAVIFRQPEPYGEWTTLDYKFLVAYQTINDETCSRCGNPVWLCHSEDTDIEWHVKPMTCYASRYKEMQEWRADNKGKSIPPNEMRRFGVDTIVVPELSPVSVKGRLPTRSEYYGGH